MGRRNKKRLNFGFILLIFILFQNICFSQTTISGKVKDSLGDLYSVSVILKDSLSKFILAYTYSKENGTYILKTNKKR